MREIRQEHGLSQEKLALETGFDRTFMSLLERGLQSPTLRTVFRLAEAMKVKPSELVRRTEKLLEEPEPAASSGRKDERI